MSQLRDLLGLPDVQINGKRPSCDEFARRFRQGISRLNERLRGVAAHAPQLDYQALDAQRMRLYAAYQSALAQIDPNDRAKADAVIQRVLSAVAALEKKTVVAAAKATAGREQWLQRQADFEETMLRIGELEVQQHPKAPAFRKLGEAIRQRASTRQFHESTKAHEQLRPKLDEIRRQHDAKATLTIERRNNRQQQLAAIRKRMQAVMDQLGV